MAQKNFIRLRNFILHIVYKYIYKYQPKYIKNNQNMDGYCLVFCINLNLYTIEDGYVLFKYISLIPNKYK